MRKTFLLYLVLLSGCSMSPAQNLDKYVAHLDFEKDIVFGDPFVHVLFKKPSENQGSRRLHVYVDGDGSPWLLSGKISGDPTPRSTLVLDLMDRDPGLAVYLGRPCYHGLTNSANCGPLLWTNGRYSEVVVHSMENVLRRLLEVYEPSHIVLIGFSGGGTLATLLADRIPEVNVLITISANLDPQSWTLYHDYSPLTESLNPSLLLPLRIELRQLHLGGADDTNIPPWMLKGSLRNQPGAIIRILDGYTHQCCWKEIWEEVISHPDSSEFYFR